MFSILNRGKKSITLNLSDERAKEILKRLVEKSDVLVENFVPGVMDKWGLGYDVLKEVNPKLIYAAISGFGKEGIERFTKKTAFDIIIQAQAGILDAYKIEGPPRIPIADYTAGHICALAISQALYYREKTGKGQFIDISMHDIMFALNIQAQAKEFISFASKLDFGSGKMLPIYNQYKCKDGKNIALTTLTERQYQRLVTEVLEKPELAKDPELDNPIKRFDHIDELDQIVLNWTKTVTREEAIQKLESVRLPCGEVYTVDETHSHPQLKARGMIVDHFNFSKWDVEKATIPGPIIKFSETQGSVDSPGPELGVNNEEIYCGLLGYNKEDLKLWKRKKVI